MYNKDRMILQKLNLIPDDSEPIEGYWGTAHFTFTGGELCLDGAGELQHPLKDDSDILSSVIDTITFQADVKAPQDAHYLFGGNSRLTRIQGLDRLDTSRTTDMAQMFLDTPRLKELDYPSLDTSQVTDMYQMFARTGLERIDLTGWDVRHVTDMSHMFVGDADLKSLILTDLPTSRVKDLSYFIHQNPALTTVDTTGLDVSQAITMENMFSDNPKLLRLDLDGFRPDHVQSTSKMFAGDLSLTEIAHLLNLVTEQYKTMEYMFSQDQALDTLMKIDTNRLYQHSDMSLDGLF